MINPETHCPRCDIRYKRNYDYDYMCCMLCGFHYYNSVEGHPRNKYQMHLYESGTRYTMEWRRYGLTVISINPPVSRGKCTVTVFEEWLPFDTTLDTLKLYVTFS